MSSSDPRPSLTPALERLLRAMVTLSPQLGGDESIDVDTIVVVALAAHGESAASVRDLRGCAKSVVVGGKTKTLELGLRPPFFFDGDAPSRLCTLCHELLHVDGDRLREANRHRNKPHEELEREARAIARDLLDVLDPKDVLCLAHDGEVLLRAWRHRPTEQTSARAFSDVDVFAQPVRLTTPADRRGGWW
jgi:hypothetical protein